MDIGTRQGIGQRHAVPGTEVQKVLWLAAREVSMDVNISCAISINGHRCAFLVSSLFLIVT